MFSETSETHEGVGGGEYDTQFAKKMGIDLSTSDGRDKYKKITARMNEVHPESAQRLREAETRLKNQPPTPAEQIPSVPSDGPPRLYGWSPEADQRKRDYRIQTAIGLDRTRGTNIDPTKEGWEERLEKVLADLGVGI